jgi:hypothetical protein
MLPIAFGILATAAALAVGAFIAAIYRSWFRRIPSLDAFNPREKLVLRYQLWAVSLWTVAAFGLFLFSVWVEDAFEVLPKPPANLILAAANIALLGFVGATSLTHRVSILAALRMGQRPAKGASAVLWGVFILALVAFGTWKAVSPPS